MNINDKLSEILNHLVSSQKETQNTICELKKRIDDYEIQKQRPNFFESGAKNSNVERRSAQDDLYHNQFIEYLRTGRPIERAVCEELSKKSIVEGACGINNDFSYDKCKDGGYLVSYNLHREILTAASEENIFRQLVNFEIVPGGRNQYITTFSEVPSAVWVSEGDNIPVTDTPLFKQLTIFLNRMMLQPQISADSLEDSEIRLVDFLISYIGKSFEKPGAISVLRGDGKG